MQKLFLLSGTTFSALAVAIGAFGAHSLQKTLEANNRLETFETGVKYQFYHAIALLFLGLYIQQCENKTLLTTSGYSFILGIIIFSGSLYTLSLTNIRILGAITPLGGLAFIIGWICLAINIVKNQF